MVPTRFAGFDPTRPFPVFVTGPFHASVVRELNACTSADEVMALFARTKGAYRNEAGEVVERCRYLELRARLSKVNGGETGVGAYSYKTCNKYLGSLRKLNPIIDALWRDAGRSPAKRELPAAFVGAVAAQAVAVDVSEGGLSDLGLRLYLSSLALRRGEPGRVHLADIDAASDAGLFPRRGIDNFAARVRERWTGGPDKPGIVAEAPTSAAAEAGGDGRAVSFAITEASAFPALARADALLFPSEDVPTAGPFTAGVAVERRAAARALPRRLVLPASARDAVRDAQAFRLARDHDLFGREVVFRQLIHGTWERVTMAVHRVVENEYRGMFFVGARLDAMPGGRRPSAPRLWCAPVRDGVLCWEGVAGPLASRADIGRICELFEVIDARLPAACAAVTDVPLEVNVLFKADAGLRDHLERLVAARRKQAQAVARDLAASGGAGGDAAWGSWEGQPTFAAGEGSLASALAMRVSSAPAARLDRVRGGGGEVLWRYRDVVVGRNDVLVEFRSLADSVVDVEARYLVGPGDPEQTLAGAGYDYLWAWDGRRLMGLGGSAVSIAEAYTARVTACGEEPPARVERQVRAAGSPEEELEVKLVCAAGAPDEGVGRVTGEVRVVVPLAAPVRAYRVARQRAGREGAYER